MLDSPFAADSEGDGVARFRKLNLVSIPLCGGHVPPRLKARKSLSRRATGSTYVLLIKYPVVIRIVLERLLNTVDRTRDIRFRDI